MIRFRMRFLLFSLILLSACASDYKTLRPATVDQQCLGKIRLEGIKTSWFDAGIDVVGKHISGLLLVKNMPDSSIRVVFTNEAGLKFLDFEFSEHPGAFKVHHVIKQLDKKPVIRLLRKDFELLLGLPFRNASWKSWTNHDQIFFGVSQKKETHYFITGKDCASLQSMESGSKRRRKVSIELYGISKQDPDSIYLQHHTFAMQIKLRKLVRE